MVFSTTLFTHKMFVCCLICCCHWHHAVCVLSSNIYHSLIVQVCVWQLALPSHSSPWWAAGPAVPCCSCTEHCSVQDNTYSTQTVIITGALWLESSGAVRLSAARQSGRRRWREASSSSIAGWGAWCRSWGHLSCAYHQRAVWPAAGTSILTFGNKWCKLPFQGCWV